MQQANIPTKELTATLSIASRLLSMTSAGLIFPDGYLSTDSTPYSIIDVLTQKLRDDPLVGDVQIEDLSQCEPLFLEGGLQGSLLLKLFSCADQSPVYFFLSCFERTVIFDEDFQQNLVFIETLLQGYLNRAFPVTNLFELQDTKPLGFISESILENDMINLVNSSPGYFAILNNDLKYQFCSKNHEEFFGLEMVDIIGKPLFDLISKEDQPLLEGVLNDAIQGKERNIEYVARQGENNEEIIANINAYPRYYKEQVVGVYVSVQDVSPYRKTLNALNELYRVTSDDELSIDDKIQKILQIGIAQYSLPFGVLGIIEDGIYTIRYCESPNDELKVGMASDLDNTYCFHAINNDEPTCFHHVGQSTIKNHSCYQTFALESYIGIVIKVNGLKWGTLNFSSPYPKQTPFEAQDIELIKLFGQWVGSVIARDLVLKSLKESEYRKRILLDSVHEGVIGVNEFGAITFVNPAACRLTNYTQEELLGQNPHYLLHHSHPDGAPNLLEDCAIQKTLISGESISSESDFVWSKMGPFIAEFSCVPFKNDDGEIDGAVVTFQDRTKQLETENLILQQKKMFESLFMNAPTAVAYYDSSRTVRMVNPAFTTLFGYTESDIIGKSTRVLYADDNDFISLGKKYYGKKPEKNTPVYHIDYKTKSSRIFPSETFGSMLKTSEGELNGYIVHISDITDRLKFEKEILTVNQRFSLASNSAGIGVWSWNLRNNDVVWDDWMWRLFGLDKQDNIDPYLCWKESMHPEDAAAFFKAFGKAFKNRENLDTDFRVVRPDGQIRYLKSTGMIEYDASGVISGITGVNFDITSRKETEEVLRKASQEAQAANKAKSDFLATMSHEIRTPLNGILGMSELLSSSQLTDEQRAQLKVLQGSGEGLLQLINEILDFSKIEAGQLTVEKQEFDLEDKILDVVRLLMIKSEEKHIDLLVEYPIQTPRYFIGDAFRIRQVLINLVSNAIKFTHEGQVIIRVNSESDNQGSASLKIEIEDTGIGIPLSAHHSLFNAFTQADSSTTRRFGGTGLGLAITKQLVELMGGEVTLKSEVGVGSTFTVSIALQESYSYRSDIALTNLSVGANYKTLVVDDNETNLTILSNQLNEFGVQCDIEMDSTRAYERWLAAYESNEPYDILVLDYQMPDLDGLGLCRLIRAKTLKTAHPIILMATSAGLFTQKTLEEVGVNVSVTKPVDSRTLLMALGVALRGDVLGKQLSYLDMIEPSSFSQSQSQRFFGRVLVVEDMSANMAVARGILKKLGVQVIEAENGQIGVQKWFDEEPDLILMDLHMPVMDGMTAMRSIRQAEKGLERRRVPIYALTADALVERLHDVHRAGGDGLIPKPFKQKDLSEVFAKHLTAEHAVDAFHDEKDKDALTVSINHIDVQALQELKKVLGDDMDMAVLFDAFHMDAKALIETLQASLTPLDLDAIFKVSHSMKSISLNLGGIHLSSIAAELELKAKRGESEDIHDLVVSLSQEYKVFCSELDKVVTVL